MITYALLQTFEQHLGLRIAQGLAADATESVRVVAIQLGIGQPRLSVSLSSYGLSCYPRSQLCINAEWSSAYTGQHKTP
jgi:hypothetical protein